MRWVARMRSTSGGAPLLLSGLAAALALSAVPAVHGQAAGLAPNSVPVSATGAATADAVTADGVTAVEVGEIATFVDTAIVSAMAEHDIPGGVFVLVADGGVAHARGYGHTDVDQPTSIDPRRTRFDIGSVSKLLTATAVMQQVERGHLD
jgi:CubicO group peptidase (beta-lactamase class C family)